MSNAPRMFEALCRAAIEQIDRESERFSFNEAVATRKPLMYSLMAIFVLAGLFFTVDFTPDASRNALKRWALSSEERYTFVEEGTACGWSGTGGRRVLCAAR